MMGRTLDMWAPLAIEDGIQVWQSWSALNRKPIHHVAIKVGQCMHLMSGLNSLYPRILPHFRLHQAGPMALGCSPNYTEGKKNMKEWNPHIELSKDRLNCLQIIAFKFNGRWILVTSVEPRRFLLDPFEHVQRRKVVLAMAITSTPKEPSRVFHPSFPLYFPSDWYSRSVRDGKWSY